MPLENNDAPVERNEGTEDDRSSEIFEERWLEPGPARAAIRGALGDQAKDIMSGAANAEGLDPTYRDQLVGFYASAVESGMSPEQARFEIKRDLKEDAQAVLDRLPFKVAVRDGDAGVFGARISQDEEQLNVDFSQEDVPSAEAVKSRRGELAQVLQQSSPRDANRADTVGVDNQAILNWMEWEMLTAIRRHNVTSKRDLQTEVVRKWLAKDTGPLDTTKLNHPDLRLSTDMLDRAFNRVKNTVLAA